ncbi:FadR/GntR family transcriptional regulator [Brachybacterium sp. DNPG3]
MSADEQAADERAAVGRAADERAAVGPASAGRAGAGATAFARALEQLGQAIVDGDLPAGHIDTVEGFVERTGASRSVVREVTRVLGMLGMLRAGRRVGLRILPREDWEVLDPHLIRWRMAGPAADAAAAGDELRALRHAVEPAAAAAAARAVREGRTPAEEFAALESAARALAALPPGTEAETFLDVDRALHAAILGLSGNALFARLGAVIDEGLRSRALRERADLPPDPHDLALHRQTVDAILAGEETAASAAMREIVERTEEP